MTAETRPRSRVIRDMTLEDTTELLLRLEVPASYPDAVADGLIRLCRLAAPMLAEGIPVESIIRKFTPREWAQRPDWPPPEAQP